MKNIAYLLGSFLLLMGLYACGGEQGSAPADNGGIASTAPTPPVSNDTKGRPDGAQPPYELADSSQIRTVEGVQIYIVEKGNGAIPKPGSTVVIDYHGYLTDGSVFDSSFDVDGPVNFNLNQLIRGWQIGLTQVPSGSKVKLIVPPELGYGANARPGIPANSTLIFDIELFSSY